MFIKFNKTLNKTILRQVIWIVLNKQLLLDFRIFAPNYGK